VATRRIEGGIVVVGGHGGGRASKDAGSGMGTGGWMAGCTAGEMLGAGRSSWVGLQMGNVYGCGC